MSQLNPPPPRSFRRGRRRLPAVLAAGAAVVTAAVTLTVATTSGTAAAAIPGELYLDPTSQVVRWVAANPNDSRTPAIRDRIASQPQSTWFAKVDVATIQQEVSAYVTAAGSKVPVLTVYGITNRDCGGASSGGAPDLATYRTWISRLAAGLGTRTAIIILEPDSLALTTCLSAADLAARNSAISDAITTITTANPNAKVYLDAGHSGWNSAADTANRLRAAGVTKAAGFYSNVSNFNSTANEVAFAKAVLAQLGSSNLHAVIDTSRNGNGSNGQWCDPAGRAIGQAPTLNTGDPAIDAFLWIKLPGEADGCAAAAGQFVPDLAYALATNGGGSTTTPPVTTTPPAPGACTVAYRVDNAWNNGFTATVTVTNGPTATNGWTVGFRFAGDQRITTLWNGTVSQSGTQVTVTNASWNGSLAPGGTASFGFQATYSGSNGAPTGFTLNGTTCG